MGPMCHLAVVLAIFAVSAPATLALEWTKGQNLCFSLGTNPKSQTAIGLCSKEKTVPTAYYMQESEKILLLKGDTDNDYLLMANTTNLISTVEGNKFDSLYTKQADFCGPTITDIKDRPDSSPTLCKGKEITGSYSALMTGMRVGEPDTAGGYVGISYALVMKGPVFLNVAKNFITLSNYDGTYIYRTTCLNGYNKTIAAVTPEKSIESALNEKFASGSHNDPVNPSLSPAICGADTKFDEGTIKFSVYSEFAGAQIGQTLRQYNWTAVRVIITLVGMNRDSVYFNKNPAMTLANLNGASVTQISVSDPKSNENLDMVFEDKFYAGKVVMDGDRPLPAAPDTEGQIVIKASLHTDSDKFYLDYLFPIDDKSKDISGDVRSGTARWMFYDPKIISTTGLFSAVGTADVQTTSAPTASANTKYFVTLTVTLPYTKVDFDKSKQDKYMAAIAAAAGTSAANVEILAITEKRRRAGTIDVETKIRASDAAGNDKVISTLGTGDVLKNKINAELAKQSLSPCLSVTAPLKSLAEFAAGGRLLSVTWVVVVTAPVVAYGLLV